MRVPIAWLRDYVPVDVSVSELVRLLNFSGTKVEAVHAPRNAISDVVVAKVLAIEPHPNADNLTLVEVQTSGDECERVVCGAKNFAVGDLVPWAKVGAHLPEMVIGERKIRGETSRGMLCSGRELGVGRDHSGILVLPPDARLGAEVGDVLGLNDTVLELELTPNRPDCMGMVGIAREVAALTGTEMILPVADSVPSDPAEADGSSGVSVELSDYEGCPRYVARWIEGVTVASSPAWIAGRLLAVGLRSISNVVDVTNYVMMELGHPLHPFDAGKVTGGSIIVRRATDGEAITTLDGAERKLTSDDLVIADPDRALALAGVMGGADSEVSAATTEVILEAAYFDPASIGATSRRHGLRSEASARFERGMDPEVLPFAAARAAGLMTEVAGGATMAMVDVYPAPIKRPRITLRPQRTDALLGVHLIPDRQRQLLRSVSFGVSGAEDALEVDVPSFRPDVTREVDLIEEVARLEGLDELPSTLPPGQLGGLTEAQSADRLMRRTLGGLGLHEAWTNSFMSPRDLEALQLPEDDPGRSTVVVANPMSEDEKLMRTTLLPGLLHAAHHNLARAASGVALFEVARVYQPSSDALPDEPTALSAVFTGNRSEQSWQGPPGAWDFFAVKGIVSGLLESLRIPIIEYGPAAAMPFHPTRTAKVTVGNATLGMLGEIHPDVCVAFDVPQGTVAFEMAWDAIVGVIPGRPEADLLPRYPAVLIDLAIVVDAAQLATEVEEAIRSAGGPETTSVRLFDIYTGPQVPESKKSLAYALELRAPDRTLTESDATEVRARILRELESRFGAKLRA
jgi:phenylalanyl-tRNA synthetase beta chain